jgi:ABC-type oligopeptide transport system ATPase subunit
VSEGEKLIALRGRGIDKIFKRNGDEIVQALDEVSLEVQAGTLTALVGPAAQVKQH